MDPKDVYEMLDVLAGASAPAMPEGALAELLMALTGTHVEERGGMAGIPAHNPDTAAEARKTVLRWLRDHGYIPRSRR